jgi:hypothetical protein
MSSRAGLNDALNSSSINNLYTRLLLCPQWKSWMRLYCVIQMVTPWPSLLSARGTQRGCQIFGNQISAGIWRWGICLECFRPFLCPPQLFVSRSLCNYSCTIHEVHFSMIVNVNNKFNDMIFSWCRCSFRATDLTSSYWNIVDFNVIIAVDNRGSSYQEYGMFQSW